MHGRVNAGWLAAAGVLALSGAAPGDPPAVQAVRDALPYERVVDSITYPPAVGEGWVWCTGTDTARNYCFDPHDSTVIRWYSLRVPDDDTITFTVSSAAFDVRMMVFPDSNPADRIINDDGAGACNARISRPLSADTTYVVVVGQHLRVPGRFAIDPSASDDLKDLEPCITDRVVPRPYSFSPVPSAAWHTLTIWPESVRVALDPRMASLSASVQVVSQGTLAVSAWLTPYDGRLGETGNAQLWPLAVRDSTDKFVLAVASREFTPDVYLIGPKAYHARFSRDSARDGSLVRNLCSTAILRLRKLPPGRYRLVVSGVEPAASGSFSLAIGDSTMTLPCPQGKLTVLRPGESITLRPTASSLTSAVLLKGQPGSLATVVVRAPGTAGRSVYVSHGSVVDSARVKADRCVARLRFSFAPDSLVRLDISDSAGPLTDFPALPVELRDGLVPDTVRNECGALIARIATDSLLNAPVGAPLPDSPYMVEIRSREFDPVALLMRGDSIVRQDDNGGSWCNARLKIDHPQDEDRLLVLDASGKVTRAVYQMSFDAVDQASAPSGSCHSPKLPVPKALLPTTSGRLALVRPWDGDLDARDSMLADTTYGERWTVPWDTGRAGKWLVLTSEEFDPYLWILGKDFILGDDGIGTCSAALPAPPDSVDIIVNSAVRKAGGKYRLGWQDAEPPDTLCLTGRYYAVDQLPAVDTLVLHAADSIVRIVRNDSLTDLDARLVEDTTWAQAVVLRLDSAMARRTLVFRLDSPAFDPWLIVTGPDGSTRENDDGGEGANSRIEWSDAPPGAYRIVVNSWGRGEEGRGAYTLIVTGHSPAPRRE